VPSSLPEQESARAHVDLGTAAEPCLVQEDTAPPLLSTSREGARFDIDAQIIYTIAVSAATNHPRGLGARPACCFPSPKYIREEVR
jgi:hypothetical protein